MSSAVSHLPVLLTLNAPIATKIVCFSRLLKCLRSLYGKQCGPRSDCSYRSSLFWVHAVCFYTLFISNARQLFAADDFSRQHFQMHFFLGALRVKIYMHCFIARRLKDVYICCTGSFKDGRSTCIQDCCIVLFNLSISAVSSDWYFAVTGYRNRLVSCFSTSKNMLEFKFSEILNFIYSICGIYKYNYQQFPV